MILGQAPPGEITAPANWKLKVIVSVIIWGNYFTKKQFNFGKTQHVNLGMMTARMISHCHTAVD